MMGGEDGTEPVAGFRQMPQHRNGIAGVHDGDAASGAQQPDVVVVESGQGKYFSH